MTALWGDVRYGFRQLRKSSGFTVVAVLTLALGIGAATAIFSAVYGVLISPYPYAKPGEIWTPGLRSAKTTQRMRPYRLSDFPELARLPAFSDVMATCPEHALLTGDFAPESLEDVRLSGNVFDFLGVPPVLGRTIQPSDIARDGEAEPVAVLSFQLWQRLWGCDPDVLGKTLRLDDRLYTVIGVMPARFGWWTNSGLWTPLARDSQEPKTIFPIVRLRPGVSPTVAEQQLHALHLQLAKGNPSAFPQEDFTSTLTNYLDITVASGEMQRSLRLLLGAVGFLLLIACVNVANLQLARATSRSREMAIRLSVGAGRLRLVSQLLTESVLMSLLAGLLGLLFAVWITKAMVALMPSFYVPNEARIGVNGSVLLFCVIVSMVTGIVFGLVPAVQSSRPDLSEALKEEVRGSSGSQGGRIRASLVVAEVALSVVLLVSAGLTIRSFIALQRVDVGFRPEHVVTVELPLPPKRYVTWKQRNRFARELLGYVQTLPGVQAATIGNGGLPFGGPQSAYALDSQGDSEGRRINFCLVGVGYLKTLGIALRRGRMLTEAEIDRADSVGVISEAAARLWPSGQDPLGRRIRLDELAKPDWSELRTPAQASPYVTIVGIIADTKNDGPRNQARPVVLVPYTLLAPPDRALAIRSQGDLGQLMNALRAKVREMDREQPLRGPFTFEEALGAHSAQPRFLMALFGLFAGFALALATAGIYSVLSYLVTSRTREVGIRIALGAQRSDVLRLIFKAGGMLAGAGILLGTLASLGVAHLLRSQTDLFQVPAVDPVALLGVVLLLGVVAAVACYLPARRAAKIDPIAALRHE